MKKKIKNIIKCAFALIMAISSIPMVANAQTINDTVYVDTSFTYDVATTQYDDLNAWVIGHENPIRRRSDNSLLYCIQAHVKFIDGAAVTGYESLNDQLNLANLTREELSRIKLLTYYGYGYDNHTSLDWYVATQLLIWQVTDKVSTPYPIEQGDTTLTRSSKYDAMMNEINYLVDHHVDVVSFDRQEVTLKVGETLTLTDTNGVLSHFYNVESNEALDLTISNDNLIIKAKKPFEGTIELNAKENTNPPYLFDGANQKCISRGDPVYRLADIKVNVLTEFKFDKVLGNSNTGAYKPEKNAKFELYNNDTNELIDTLTTDSDGFSNTYLRFGTYRLHQLEGKEGYKFISDYIFTIDGTEMKEVMHFNNEKIKADVIITKTDISTGEVLPNTKIDVYNADTNELVFSDRTGEDGNIIIKNLEYGNYYFIESEAPAGYELNTEKMYFSITEDGKVIKSSLKDKKIKEEEKPQEEIIKVPDTGINSFDVISNITWLFIIAGLGYILYAKVKKEKK